jgi:hypothetical protein
MKNECELLTLVRKVSALICESELELLGLTEQLIIKSIKNKKITLEVKTELFAELEKINRRQLAMLGAAVQSRFPNKAA